MSAPVRYIRIAGPDRFYAPPRLQPFIETVDEAVLLSVRTYKVEDDYQLIETWALMRGGRDVGLIEIDLVELDGD